jgi:hypothetical protein
MSRVWTTEILAICEGRSCNSVRRATLQKRFYRERNGRERNGLARDKLWKALQVKCRDAGLSPWNFANRTEHQSSLK